MNRRNFIGALSALLGGTFKRFGSQGAALVPVVGEDRSIGAGVRGEILDTLRSDDRIRKALAVMTPTSLGMQIFKREKS